MSTFRVRLPALWNRVRFRLAALLLAALILLISLPGVAFAPNVVYIHDDKDVYKFFTTNSRITAEEVLRREGLEVSPRDEIIFSGFDREGVATLEIYRSFCLVIHADGEEHYVMMTRGTVGDALEKAGLTLAPDDLINVSPYENAVSGMEIEINRVTFREVTETTAIPFEVETKETKAVTKGKIIVTRTGEEGKQVAKFKQTLVDGEVSRVELLSTEITKQPVTQKQVLGTSLIPIASQILPPDDFELDSNGVPTHYSRVLTGKATAYSSRRYPKVRGASGQYLKPGSVAVDPRIIPYGTHLYIASTNGRYIYGYAVAADTGTAMVDGRVLVDCFFETYAESCYFGAKTVNVYVLD